MRVAFFSKPELETYRTETTQTTSFAKILIFSTFVTMNDFDGFYVLVLGVPLALAGLLVWLYKNRSRHNFQGRGFVISWNVLLTITLLTTVFFGFETYYRFFLDTTTSFANDKISQRWGERHYQMNNFMARDNVDYRIPLANGVTRVSFLGDSFTVGYGLKNVEDRFANIIRRIRPDIEIHVLAGNGLETDEQLGRLQKLKEYDGYEFDHIVLVYNLNDI